MSRWFLLPVLSAAVLSGQSLTQGERDFAMSHLHATRKMFLDSVAGLTPEQWNFKPAPGRWSVAECAEHITVSEDFIFGLIQGNLKTPPATAEQLATVKGKDNAVVTMVADRSQKAQAPEAIRPTGRWADEASLVTEFKQRRDHTIAYVEATGDELRAHVFPHPLLGPLDAYQWMLLLSAHTGRHTEQINEVKADPNFPK